MKFLKAGLSLAVVGATLSVLPGGPSVAVGSTKAADDTSVTARMRDAADGSVRITTSRATGKVGFIAARGTDADLLPTVQATSKASAVAKATTYLDRFGSAFGLADGQLRQSRVLSDAYGWVVTYDQQYQGVPVFGARLKANVDRSGDLTAIAGYAAPDLDLSTTPRVSAAKAAERAVAFVKSDPPTSETGAPADTTRVKAVANQLNVYRMGALRGDRGPAVLAYVVEVSDAKSVRDMVFIDANTGKPVNRYSMIADGLDRELQEATGTAQAPVLTTVWKEGDPFPGTLNDDQQNLVNSSGESYWMYENAFGFDSYDGAGAKRITVNNDPRISCPNANWNGTTTNYCDGVTSDDVVAHEWGHAYTEYTSGLIYQYQSGALNESYSDVWGETLDLVNGREDEGEGDLTVKRADGACDPTAPAKLQVSITAPPAAAGPCTATAAGFGPAFTTTPVTPQVVVAVDAADQAGPSTTDGCSTFTNAAAIVGNYAFADRGSCTFQTKINNAVAAGATGLVLGQNVAGLPSTASGTSTIPGFMVTQANATRIKSAGTVTMSIAAEDTSSRTPTNRWLIGEKSEAFGGAIRDMWTPTCYGNPGKVSDAEYNCDPNLTDSGGVHGNSGVPNHAYALVVDGGTFNGQTITGLGLDKAANIWWYAQTHYLTPSSDFTDAADALEQSCADLVGETINKITTATDAGPTAVAPLTTADCTSVSKAMTAVEMRTEPVQCNFQPLLATGSLNPCGDGTVTETTVLDDFENGISAWTLEQQLGTGGNQGYPWEADDTAPAGRAGTVAYAADPDEGSCSAGDDISSRDSMISPAYTVPSGASPRVTFDHYVATEAGYDGGNVKVSLNGGPFTAVPSSAFLFNPYNATMATSATNTSPLAGQAGFTGTDGGKTIGSWGESTISLAKLGAKPGDSMKIRFDFGRDGCGGNDGWYLDNLELSVCKKVAEVTAVHDPEPSTYGTASTVEVTAPAGATGTVTLLSGDTTIATATLADGAASIPLPATVRAGSYDWTVDYSGDSQYGASTVDVTVTVDRAASTTQVVSAPAQVKRNARAKVKVVVASSAGTPTGRVVLKRGGVVYGRGVLSDGTVTITTRKLSSVGLTRLTASYLGGVNYLPSTARRITIIVKK
ncbi:M4 family metallopeptidase [Nocardioides rubriscoriae]|uniref:M4 family metallopeptidase n=1 Tax=Nocardioides rubriscoriae TaxID=642762 RepID=UPI0014786C36|nr:M4 family metallopeptidase [Nocardioides rubriscoriae]